MKNPDTAEPTKEAKLMSVIVTKTDAVLNGVSIEFTSYWSVDGEFLFQKIRHTN